jgi:hypothetical protein
MEDRVGRSQGTRSGVAEEEEEEQEEEEEEEEEEEQELELELESETKLGGNGKVLVNEVNGVRVPRIQKSALRWPRDVSKCKTC